MKAKIKLPTPLPPLRKRPEDYTDAEEHKEAVCNYRRLRQERMSITASRGARKLGEVIGTGLRVSDQVCHCGTHYMMIVRCNGDDVSQPLCPIAIGLRRARLDLRNGRQPDVELMPRLLEQSALKA